MSTALRAALPLILALSAATASAQSISLPGGTYSQDFDTLSNTAGSTTNTALPAGWLINETGGGARDNEQYAVDTGGSNTGDTYSYGNAGATDRALGALRSGTLIATWGACFTNATGGTVNALEIAYTGEQWRLGTAGRIDSLVFEYSTDATSLTTGTWTAHAPLNFVTPNTVTTGPKDGNAAENRTALSSTVNATIANGADFCLRWSDTDASGADDGLAIDDFSITVGAAPPAPDFSVSIGANPASVSVGEVLEVRTTFRNLGQVYLPLVTTTQTVPSGLTQISLSTQNGVGFSQVNCPSTSPTLDCEVSLDPGASFDLVATYTVEAGTATPLLFQVSGNPPPADSNPNNNSASVSVNVVQVVGIAAIQGTGTGSPLPLGSNVVTEGIVTATRGNGYFIQSAPGDEDGNPATAEGLFVFTGTNNVPAGAAVGNRVRVTGNVTEFRRTPHGYPLTQLGTSSLAVLATGQPLPAPVVIDASVLAPDVSIDAMGRYQGMRVQLPAATVVGPTNRDGWFFVTRAGEARPAREPGIFALDAVPLPVGNNIPRFDGNPERLRVESNGLIGATPRFYDAGTLLEDLRGVMYYDSGDFTLLMGAEAPVASGGAFIGAVPGAPEGAIRIGSYNIENFALTGDFTTRLAKLSEVFCQYLGNPDIVGLVEIANLQAAQRLADAINSNEFDTCPASPQYQAYVLSNNGTQRLGFLVKTTSVAGGQPRVDVDAISQIDDGVFLTTPAGTPSASVRLFDRPPLVLEATVNGDNGQAYPLVVMVNHTLSLLDVNDLSANAEWGTLGARSRDKRRQQAERISVVVEAIQDADPSRPVVLVGDYNAFEFNDGYVDVMGIISGSPAPADQVLLPGTSALTRPLVNLLDTVPVADRYSYVFSGSIQSLDHALANEAAFDTAQVRLYHARVNSDFATDNAADPTVPVRTSDHDPLVAELRVGQFLDADVALAIPAARKPVLAGDVATFRTEVANLGAADAIELELLVEITNPAVRLLPVDASAWTCSAPVDTDTGSRFSCRRDGALAAGASEMLPISFNAVRLGGIEDVEIAVTATTLSRDTVPANDQATGTIRVVGRPLNPFDR